MADPGTDETPNADKGNLPEAVMKVLEDIKAKVDAPRDEAPALPSVPSSIEQRETEKKRMGFSEEQMQAHESSIQRATAPVVENLGWMRLEKKTDIEVLRKEIEGELNVYPPERRTPEIMEKIYYMVKGKHADSRPASPTKPPAAGGRVVSTRVSAGPGYTGAESVGSSDQEGAQEPDAISEAERFVVGRLNAAHPSGLSEADYLKSKKAGRDIREFRVPDSRQAQSMADIELRRLQGRR